MIWLLAPILAVVLSALVLARPRTEFHDLLKRERALKALGKRYDPEQDTVLKRRRRKTREPELTEGATD